jgi:hypothetical protein
MSNERDGATRGVGTRHPLDMNAAAPLLIALVIAALSPTVQARTPCETPELFVRAFLPEASGSTPSAPLLRPYLIAGIAAIGLREEGGQRWLELAVHSAADARKQLSARTTGAEGHEPVLATRGERVWLRCPAALSAGL